MKLRGDWKNRVLLVAEGPVQSSIVRKDLNLSGPNQEVSRKTEQKSLLWLLWP